MGPRRKEDYCPSQPQALQGSLLKDPTWCEVDSPSFISSSPRTTELAISNPCCPSPGLWPGQAQLSLCPCDAFSDFLLCGKGDCQPDVPKSGCCPHLGGYSIVLEQVSHRGWLPRTWVIWERGRKVVITRGILLGPDRRGMYRGATCSPTVERTGHPGAASDSACVSETPA